MGIICAPAGTDSSPDTCVDFLGPSPENGFFILDSAFLAGVNVQHVKPFRPGAPRIQEQTT
jgi:hypothetical protein